MEEIMVFPSTFHMLRAEGLLKREGFAHRLVPSPPWAGELCTTAVAIFAGDRGEITRRFGEEGIEIHAVLPYEKSLSPRIYGVLGSMVEKAASHPWLREVLDKLREGEGFEAAELERLLRCRGEEREVLLQLADTVARSFFGDRVTALVGLRMEEARGPSTPSSHGKGLREGGGVADLPAVATLVGDMAREGFVHLLVDTAGSRGLPWPARDWRRAVGDGVVAILGVGGLTSMGGKDPVREYGFKQVLVRGGDIFKLDESGLAEEIIFLRDNRCNPIASGNLVPLPDLDFAGEEREALERVENVLAVCRLVLGGVFLPAPPSLWGKRELAGANLLVLDATRGPLEKVGGEAEKILRGKRLEFARAGRRGGAAPQ